MCLQCHATLEASAAGSQLRVWKRISNPPGKACPHRAALEQVADPGLRAPGNETKRTPGHCHALSDTVTLGMAKERTHGGELEDSSGHFQVREGLQEHVK